MAKRLDDFKRHLKAGQIYRRSQLAEWSGSVDLHIRLLLQDGTLRKLFRGMYYVPKQTVFGVAPPEDTLLVRAFLKDSNFLLFSANAYNCLGVGTTQLYNERLVYNRKRRGEITLDGKRFFFVIARFPKKLNEEFLLVDLINNLHRLAEDKESILKNAFRKMKKMDQKRLKRAIDIYGTPITKQLYSQL